MKEIITIVIVVLIIVLLFITMKEIYEDGYKKGQIDMKNGVDNFSLVEFEDGVRGYYKNSDLKYLKPHKIILNHTTTPN